MSAKKVPTGTKILLAVTGFIFGLYVIVIGYSYTKAWYDFRPYRKLATELNEALGGGFTITEHRHCGLEGVAYPSVEMYKDARSDTAGRKYVEFARSYTTQGLYTDLGEITCSDKKQNQCILSAIYDGKLSVTFSTLDETRNYIEIHKK